MSGTDKFTKAIDQSEPGVSNGVDINGVSFAPLRAGKAPGFKMALTHDVDAAAAANVPEGVKGFEVYCQSYDVRVAVGEVAIEGTTSVASVGVKVAAGTVCYYALDPADVAAGVKIHVISTSDTTVEIVYRY